MTNRNSDILKLFYIIYIHARILARVIPEKRLQTNNPQPFYIVFVNICLQTFVYVDFLANLRGFALQESKFLHYREYRIIPSKAERRITSMGDGFFPLNFL